MRRSAKATNNARPAAGGAHLPATIPGSAESRAAKLLTEFALSTLPIPVDVVAKRLGLTIEKAALGDDVSGVLVVQDGRGVIGVNVHQALSRQRFTIAHECGHFLLHRGKLPVFIDKHFLGSYFAAYRDSTSSTGENRMEREANAFAAALLMPAPLVVAAIAELPPHLSDEEAVETLARRCQVSRQAMSFRLANLAAFVGEMRT